MTSTPSTGATPARILAILAPDPATQVVRRLFEEEGLSVEVRDPAEGPEVWTNGSTAQAVVVDDSLEPSEVADAIERGMISIATPIFVLARRLPDRDRYLAWLETGAWDIVKIPLEGVALALRLHNILAGRFPGVAAIAERRYTWDSLVRVADETLHLSQRYARPLHCVAISAHRTAGQGPVGQSMLNRFADVAQRFTRRSDLIGLGAGALLILLPDTDLPGAMTFLRRLEETIDAKARSWGEPATLRTAIASGADSSTGEGLLQTVIAGLGSPA
jgi:DNA-binding response OmpR family regulator